MLMDTTVASGAAAIMAMRVLVEHDVPEDHIILISLIMAIQGVHSVAYTYPNASRPLKLVYFLLFFPSSTATF